MSNDNLILLPNSSDIIYPIYASYCIDYRYDSLSSEYLSKIGYRDKYFLGTAAGAALSLGFENFCKRDCSKNNYTPCCNPKNKTIEIIKNGIMTNLKIALTLRPINTIYLLNHQQCGAILAFLLELHLFPFGF